MRGVIIPFYSTLIRPQLDAVSSFQPPNRKTSINWSRFGRGPPRLSGAGALALCGDAEGAGLVQPGEEMACGDLRTANMPVFWQVNSQAQGAVAAEQQVFVNFMGPKYCMEAA